jgi:hypothetical protein
LRQEITESLQKKALLLLPLLQRNPIYIHPIPYPPGLDLLSSDIKRPEIEDEYSPQSNVEGKNTILKDQAMV